MGKITEEALALFTEQFKESKKINDLASALIYPMEFQETTIEDLLNNRWIDTASGMQLDRLGLIVGVPRGGRSDEDYRSAIKFQVFINTSNANPQTIIKSTRELSQGDLIRYWENYPAGFQVFTNGPNVLDVSGSVIQNFLFALDNNDLFVLDNNDNFEFRTAYEDPTSLGQFLQDVAPVAVDFIAVSFSLGNVPIFGFSGDFIRVMLETDNGDKFALDNEDDLQVVIAEPLPSPDGFKGFAEMVVQIFNLDNGDELELSIQGSSQQDILGVFDQTQDPEGGGKLVEGMVS
mgnify:CR=1 FL=1